MLKYDLMPIGSIAVVNSADTALMTHLGKFGWTTISGLGNNEVEIRRDFWRLYTQQEFIEQMAPPPTRIDKIKQALPDALRWLIRQFVNATVGFAIKAVLRRFLSLFGIPL